jgi:TfoX/Sxy family transcriptional regulator of competence genes
MGYDRHSADRVRRILAGRAGVVEKRMVGGLSFMVGGSMCCGITGGDLMVRVGAEKRDAVLELPHVHPMRIGGRALAGFVAVEPAGYRTEAALKAWIALAVEFVSTMRNRRPQPKPRADSSVAKQRFAALVAELTSRPGITVGTGRRGFGSDALAVDGRIFAMVASGGDLVLKLPATRVAALLAAKRGTAFSAGKSRPMKEWIALAPDNRMWRSLAEEALAFVSAT